MRTCFAIALCATLIWILGFGSPTFAADLEKGGKIFNANCAACHFGGGNVVMTTKTLKQEALTKNNMASVEAIKKQVKYGKNSMPSFQGRLNDEQIENVTHYVLAQSKKGW